MLIYVLIVAILAIYWICTRNLTYWKKRNVAGPKPIPLFGNLKETFFRRQHLSLLYEDIYNEFRKEKLIGIYRMTSPTLIVSDLDLIKDILIKNFDAFADRGADFGTLNENLFSADDEKWRLLRSKFSPLFTSGKLKNMFYLLDNISDKLINYLTVDAKTVEYDVKEITQKYTISTISACAFGMDMDLNDDKNMKALFKMDEEIFKLTYFIEFDLLFPGTLKKLMFLFTLFPSSVDKFFFDLVRTVSAERNDKSSGRNDFMDLILELVQKGEVHSKDGPDRHLKITEKIIAAQAFVFFAAGYETSASTLSFLIYELAKNQSIQDKLIAEVDEVTARHSGKVTFDSLQEMHYLHRVFDETLRMYPLLDTLQRCAKRNYTLPGTNLTVEKDTIVLIPVRGIHHNEEYYSNPEIFDPDRFLPENVRERHPCSYLPFGTGPRNCIGVQQVSLNLSLTSARQRVPFAYSAEYTHGLRFGKLQSAVCIAKLLSRFRVHTSLETPKSVNVNPNRILYCPVERLHLNFVRRDL